MATKEKETVVHRKTFQNVNNVVEVTVKTIPKGKVSTVGKGNFVRDCQLLKEFCDLSEKELHAKHDELTKVSSKQKNHEVVKTARQNSKESPVKKKVNTKPFISELVDQKKRKAHPIVPPESTWVDVLSNYSSMSDMSCDSVQPVRNESCGLKSAKENDVEKPSRQSRKKTTVNAEKVRPIFQEEFITGLRCQQHSKENTDPIAKSNLPAGQMGNLEMNQGKKIESCNKISKQSLEILDLLQGRFSNSGDQKSIKLIQDLSGLLLKVFCEQKHDDDKTEKNVLHEPDHGLTNELSQCQAIIADQEKTIQELRSLSAKIITHQTKLTKNEKKTAESRPLKEVDTEEQVQLKPMGHKVSVSTDSTELEKEETRKLRLQLLQVETEKESLLKEVHSQRDLIWNLEIQLTKVYHLLDVEKRCRSALSNFSQGVSNTHHQDNKSIAGSDADSAYVEQSPSRETPRLSSLQSVQVQPPSNLDKHFSFSHSDINLNNHKNHQKLLETGIIAEQTAVKDTVEETAVKLRNFGKESCDNICKVADYPDDSLQFSYYNKSLKHGRIPTISSDPEDVLSKIKDVNVNYNDQYKEISLMEPWNTSYGSTATNRSFTDKPKKMRVDFDSQVDNDGAQLSTGDLSQLMRPNPETINIADSFMSDDSSVQFQHLPMDATETEDVI